MRRNISRRIERLEQRAGLLANEPLKFFVFFVSEWDSSPVRAEFDGLAWKRAAGEEEEAFEARILADLDAGGYRPPFLIKMFDR